MYKRSVTALATIGDIHDFANSMLQYETGQTRSFKMVQEDIRKQPIKVKFFPEPYWKGA